MPNFLKISFYTMLAVSVSILSPKNTKEITLATSLPLKLGLEVAGTDISAGMTTIINKVNKTGGIGGKIPLKILMENDSNKIEASRDNFISMFEKSKIVTGCLGPDVLLSSLSLIKQKKVSPIFCASGDVLFRDSPKEALFFRPPIAFEVKALLDYAIDVKLRTKIAVFYEESLFGSSGLKAAEHYLKSKGMKIVVSDSYPKNSISIISAVKKISREAPSVILCIAHALPAYNFIRQIINENLADCLFLGVGEMFPIQQMIRKSRGIELVLSSVTPNPFLSKLKVVEEYRKDMATFFPNRKLSPLSLEAYLAMQLMVSGLEKIDLEEDNFVPKLIGLLQHHKPKDFDLDLKFDSVNNCLQGGVWININPDVEWEVKKQAEPVGQDVKLLETAQAAERDNRKDV